MYLGEFWRLFFHVLVTRFLQMRKKKNALNLNSGWAGLFSFKLTQILEIETMNSFFQYDFCATVGGGGESL